MTIMVDPAAEYVANTDIKTIMPIIQNYLQKTYGIVNAKFIRNNNLVEFKFVLKHKPDTNSIAGSFSHMLKNNGLASIKEVTWDDKTHTLIMSCLTTKP